MYRDYHKKGVNFYYIYSNLQHPEINGFVAPYNLKERQLHIKEVKRRSGTKMPWLCDTMDNQIKSALNAAPNGEYLFDREGKLVVKRFWSDPNKLRKDLERIVGPVEKITKVSDLETVFKVEPRKIASGVMPKIKIPSRMVPLVVEPVVESNPGIPPLAGPGKENPFYVKLRAEIQQSALGSGKGKLYLGFYVDPLHRVHWNNAAGAVTIQFKTPEIEIIGKSKRAAFRPKAEADIDPRQFLVDVSKVQRNKSFLVEINCTICDDEETFCLPFSQTFKVVLNRDRFGGSRPGVFMPRMFANVRSFDKNRDGVITIDELPKNQTSLFIGHMDKNNDQKIDKKEIDEFFAMFENGKGFSSNKNDGS